MLRATASAQIGTGHILRLLALAQAWLALPAPVALATVGCPPALAARLHAEGVEVIPLASDEDGREFAKLVEARKPAWIAWDGFHFQPAYFEAVRGTGARGLLIEDFPRTHPLPVEVVVNYNFSATPQDYPLTEPGSEFLLGPSYFLLRKEFWPYRQFRRTVAPQVEKILITMGGADIDNVTLQVLRELECADVPSCEVIAVLGAANPHEAVIREAAREFRHRVTIQRNVADMPALMAWADLSIAAAGVTAWELCYMQSPTILLVTAENQKNNARTLPEAGVALHADGEKATLSACLHEVCGNRTRREQIVQASQHVVDGDGVFRVRDAMLRRASGHALERELGVAVEERAS